MRGVIKMSTEITTLVNQCYPRFQEVSRTNGDLVKWQKESQFAIQALQKNKTLASAAPHTIENAIINVAATGLTLNPADGYAYLVPEYDKELKGQVCHLRISFKGLIKAATDSGVIDFVRANTVREKDSFTYKGISEEPIHEMNPFSKDRGELVGVYCVAKTTKGDFLCDVMSWEEVEKIRAAAKTKMVWDQWPEEMAKKAIIKRAAKQWPKSNGSQQLHETIQVINDSEGSDSLAILSDVADEIIATLENDDLFGFGEIWESLDERQKEVIWTAKTKGGYFNQAEKEQIRAWAIQFRKLQNETLEGEAQEVKEAS